MSVLSHRLRTSPRSSRPVRTYRPIVPARALRHIRKGPRRRCGFSVASSAHVPMRRLSGRCLDASMDTRVVVVGNGVSGFACAARLADHDVRVTMIGPGLPHDRPPLSKRALTTGRVPVLADAAKLAERGIEHLDGMVTRCDLDRRQLVVEPSNGGAPLTLDAATLVWA